MLEKDKQIHHKDNQDSIFIIGYGDIGRRVAKLCLAEGNTVSGLARSSLSQKIMINDGVAPFISDLDDIETLSTLSFADTLVFYFAPPPATGSTDPRMKNFLASLDREKLPV